MDKNQMLIKMKLPERKCVDSDSGVPAHLVINNKGFNKCRDLVESLNQPLVRGMEIDIEAFAKDMFEVCVYPGLEKWEEQTNHIKTRWRTNAEIIRDNAHVWLKEMRNN